VSESYHADGEIHKSVRVSHAVNGMDARGYKSFVEVAFQQLLLRHQYDEFESVNYGSPFLMMPHRQKRAHAEIRGATPGGVILGKNHSGGV
jgi:hypothetical protein